MAAAVGGRVRHLRRLSVGPLLLGELAPGAWRPLDAVEVDALRRAAGLTGPRA